MVSTKKQTFCRICHAACPVEVEIAENKVISVRGVKEDPLFKGYTCIKGRQIPDQINSQERLLFHLRKANDGHFEEIARDEGFDEVAKILLKNYDKIKHHHKELIRKDSLKAGTYLGVYPKIVKDTVEMVRKKYIC